MADARHRLNKSIFDLGSEILLYACKIKETTDGRGRSRGRQTWRTFQIVAQRRVTRNVQVDEQKRASENGQDQAQGKANQDRPETLTCVSSAFPFARVET